MYILEKEVWISAAHHLPEYSGDCNHVHGHNWRIIVTCQCKDNELAGGMVIDFKEITSICHSLDHQNLNDFSGLDNPTAENIAKYLCVRIPRCTKIAIYESEGSKAVYIKE